MGERRITADGRILEKQADGSIIEVGGGTPQGNIYTMPMTPQQQAQEARANQQLGISQQSADRAAQAQAQAMALAQQKAQREALEWAATHNPDGSPKLTTAQKPTLSAKERADALAGYTSATQLDSIIGQLERQFKDGPGATKGIYGLKDYFGTTANQQFDKTGNAARGIVGTAMGFTGGQLNTAAEAEAAVGPYLPQSNDRDSVILDKIQRLKELRDLARQRSVAILGGVPDANGNVTPVPVGQNAMDQAFVQGGNGVQALPAGAQNAVQQLPEPMRAEYAAYVAQNAGRIDPAAYAAFRNQLNAKYSFASDGSDYANEAATLNDYYAKGGRTFGNIPDPPKTLSTREWLDNTAANNPVGAALAGAGNIGGFIEGQQPEKYAALREAQGLPLLAGEIGGSIIGTKALGAIGGANRINNPFLRNLATDTAYGGIYGQNTQGDALSGAAFGAAGSALGQGLGSTLGRIAGGIAESPAAAYLRSRGMQGMTVGQRIGGFAKAVEDRATSMPGIGDIIRNRRTEGFQDFNRLAFDEAGAPVGARTSELGMNGIDDLRSQIGNAYDQATAGVDIPLDAQFPTDLAAIGSQSRMLPTDLAPRFNRAMDNAIQPIHNSGRMTGERYQQAVRSLKGYRAETTKPGFEADYRGLLSQAENALTGQMQRGGGQSVVDGLNRANTAYRGSQTLKKAVIAAKNGSGSGEGQIFTPAQLNTASFQTASKFPGPRPFADLAENGQAVLPSAIPDSGTAGRSAQLAGQLMLPSVLGGGGFAADKMGLTDSGTVTGLGLAALLAAGGTKAGQKAIGKALFDRPKVGTELGALIRKHKGLFGSAAIPLSIEAGN